MCVFCIEILTAGRIWMKYGTQVVLESRKVLGGGVDPVPPIPQVQGVREASVASAVRFGKNLINKICRAPPIQWGGSHFRPWEDLGPMCFWRVCNIKAVVYVLGISFQQRMATGTGPMSGYLNKLESPNPTYYSILFLKPHLNDPGQRQLNIEL